MRALTLLCLIAPLTLAPGCPTDPGDPDGGSPDAASSDDGGSTDGGGTDGGGIPPWPATADAYTAELTAYVNDLQKPAKVGFTYACCRDFGAISKDKIEEDRDDLDNAVAAFFDALGLLTGVNLQDNIDENLTDGSLMILFDPFGYRAPDEAFVLARFDGAFEGTTTFTEAAAGNGTFLLARDSFLPGTGEPQTKLDATISSAGELHATGPSLDFALGLYGATLKIRLEDLVFDATADETSSTLGYRRGKMSGYFTVDAFFDAINTYVEDSCGCLGLAAPLFSKDGAGTWSGDCVVDAATACALPEESFCVTMGNDDALSSCVLTPQILPDAADLDIDGDPATYEALSLGFTWTAAPAEVVGLSP